MLPWPHPDLAIYALQRLPDCWLVRAPMSDDPHHPIARVMDLIEDKAIGFSTKHHQQTDNH
jgi:hypothetical protein